MIKYTNGISICLIFFTFISFNSSYAQKIEKVTYSFVGGSSKLIYNQFILNVDVQLLAVESADTTVTHFYKLSKSRINRLNRILDFKKLNAIPDSTSYGADGITYLIKIEYENHKTVIKEAWSAYRSKKFMKISNFFQTYERRKESDYFYL